MSERKVRSGRRARRRLRPLLAFVPFCVAAPSAFAQLAPERAGGENEAAETAPGPAIEAPALGAALLRAADTHLGERYVRGGTSGAGGFDCSGFVQSVFGEIGIRLPRTSRQQVHLGRAVRRPRHGAWETQLHPGDLLFFASRGRRIDHVAIYAGDGTVVHATAYGRTVRRETLDSTRGRWLLRHLVAARRVLGVVTPTDWTAPELGAALFSGAEPAAGTFNVGSAR
jgi:cell wall-associated NlpC family hydrolase